MFDPKSFEILLGQHVVDVMREEQLRECRSGRYEGTFASVDVCALQSRQHARGVRGLALVNADLSPHAYDADPNWHLRSDSGLSAGVVASRRMGNVDGTLESAMEWAKRWVAEDPANRYVWRRR